MTLPRPNRRALVVGIALATVATMVGIGTNALAGTTDPGTPTSASPSIKHPAKMPRTKNAKANAVVKDSYIVVLKDKKASKATVHSLSSSLSSNFGGKVSHEFSGALSGYAATLTAAQVARVKADSRVAYVEPNYKYSLTQTNPPSWGLDRIDQTFGLNKSYSPPTAGSGVTAYVIDSGIRKSHTDFGGRASYGTNVADPTVDPDDCLGHGTHVAGTIGGSAYGVAKAVQLVAVRVSTGCTTEVDEANLLAGINWVKDNAVKPAVANISIGGPIDAQSAAVADAIRAAIASGITFSIAAGNAGDDACNYSPSNVTDAIIVGATNLADFAATFSNFGPCIDVFAPGVGITSDYNTSDTATAVLDGTSMAAPHVTGAAALLLSADSTMTPAQVADKIKSLAVPRVVHFEGAGSPNLLLNVNGTTRATTFGLRAHANNMYVTADPAGTTPLIANRPLVNGWELFDVVPASDGYVALKARANGKYVSAESAGAKPLVANRTAFGAWEQFKIVPNVDGSVALQARVNGKYVSADNGGKSGLIANRSSVGNWETFDESGQAPSILLKAGANGKYVTAESGGAKPLIANRTVPGGWELFDVADMLDGFVALRSHANGKFVTAGPSGTQLIAGKTAVGGWEQFYWWANGSGQSGFVALSNLNWVAAESAGAQPLINNRPAVDSNGFIIPPGGWEIFYAS